MGNIYIFNPENDLAVAHGRRRYDAPKAARRLASDLSLLPLWYAENKPDSMVLTDFPIPSDYGRELFSVLGIEVGWSCSRDYTPSSGDVYHPWGWSWPVADRIERLVGGAFPLPDLQSYRKLSGRQFAVSVLRDLQAMNALDCSVSLPLVGSTLEELSRSVAIWGGPCLMKSPWSGSGRGLLWVNEGWTEAVGAWCANVLKRQGEVICEPRYEKVQDFAMEFRVTGGRLSFVGYSYFQTDDSGTYRGNLLASDSYIEGRLSSWVTLSELSEARSSLMRVLNERLAPHYEGHFGVDMMVCRSKGYYFLHPCVELNLRFNMGLVAHSLFENYIHPDAVGRYAIMHGRGSSELRAFVAQMRAHHPLSVNGGRIERGFLPMTYLCDDAEFLAYCIV